jgi:hypothetical protein
VGSRFFAHVQIGPGTFCTMGTGSFQGVKRPGRGADHPPPSSAEVENEWSYTSTPPLGHEACYRVNFTFLHTSSHNTVNNFHCHPLVHLYKNLRQILTSSNLLHHIGIYVYSFVTYTCFNIHFTITNKYTLNITEG